ncbi:hypothetical protein P154DRAFT_448690, partial [Amniculicola lignicola CBS 123094]
GRCSEGFREILAFSILYDHRSVQIYGHYAVIDGFTTTFYCYPIREFSFQEQEGKEKWTVYTFQEWLCRAVRDVTKDVVERCKGRYLLFS